MTETALGRAAAKHAGLANGDGPIQLSSPKTVVCASICCCCHRKSAGVPVFLFPCLCRRNWLAARPGFGRWQRMGSRLGNNATRDERRRRADSTFSCGGWLQGRTDVQRSLICCRSWLFTRVGLWTFNARSQIRWPLSFGVFQSGRRVQDRQTDDGRWRQRSRPLRMQVIYEVEEAEGEERSENTKAE
jgi:hypothetical protein